MCTGRWQGVIPAWAVRGQAYPAVGAELPMRFNLAAAIAAFLEELVKRLPALEHGGLYAALLGLLLFLADHCAPSVLQGPASRTIDSQIMFRGSWRWNPSISGMFIAQNHGS